MSKKNNKNTIIMVFLVLVIAVLSFTVLFKNGERGTIEKGVETQIRLSEVKEEDIIRYSTGDSIDIGGIEYDAFKYYMKVRLDNFVDTITVDRVAIFYEENTKEEDATAILIREELSPESSKEFGFYVEKEPFKVIFLNDKDQGIIGVRRPRTGW